VTGVASLTVTVSRTPEIQIAPPARLRDRLIIGIGPRHLDVALANGVPSETNSVLALRARHLTRQSRRRELAEGIRTVLDRAGRGPSLGISPLGARVTAASDELARLADSLAQPGPVAPRGVAQALLLLTDGTGPLYNPRSGGSVRGQALAAAANLSVS
jgi:hypothetical protein